MEPIKEFQRKYRFLSNFYPSSIQCSDGILYPTVEHAYQAHKSLDRYQRSLIAGLSSPGDAKRQVKKIHIRNDWDQVKLGIMENLVRLKFMRCAELKIRLIETGDSELIEGNSWGDRYWGVCKGRGENHLGKILMKIREEEICQNKMKNYQT